ncbi:hypothetical protein SAV14893_038840 [Streptomyces avermitilis]|uniref:Uncharacterized protein n=1 Tax=Streptomyces avermitilis TaxID=33903 RepID=A0A4D4LSE0_STRAX|nr:hypothetical protein SAVMC3_50820 [Streptomyces avermitilis]GDY64491.1 hypothetical protein SAV14893_038840 [Streptomyces avermitilis]
MAPRPRQTSSASAATTIVCSSTYGSAVTRIKASVKAFGPAGVPPVSLPDRPQPPAGTAAVPGFELRLTNQAEH